MEGRSTPQRLRALTTAAATLTVALLLFSALPATAAQDAPPGADKADAKAAKAVAKESKAVAKESKAPAPAASSTQAPAAPPGQDGPKPATANAGSATAAAKAAATSSPTSAPTPSEPAPTQTPADPAPTPTPSAASSSISEAIAPATAGTDGSTAPVPEAPAAPIDAPATPVEPSIEVAAAPELSSAPPSPQPEAAIQHSAPPTPTSTGSSSRMQYIEGADEVSFDSTPETDSDGDGLSDALELQVGTDPHDAASPGHDPYAVLARMVDGIAIIEWQALAGQDVSYFLVYRASTQELLGATPPTENGRYVFEDANLPPGKHWYIVQSVVAGNPAVIPDFTAPGQAASSTITVGDATQGMFVAFAAAILGSAAALALPWCLRRRAQRVAVQAPVEKILTSPVCTTTVIGTRIEPVGPVLEPPLLIHRPTR